MEVLLNDLSLHGQFASIHDFQDAIRSIMRIRKKMWQYGRELYCHRNVVLAKVTYEKTMQQAVKYFDQNERRAIMGWLTQHGPFWEDSRSHGPDDYFEFQNQIVTDTALGEAAYRCFSGSEYQLISLATSDWLFTPIRVVWYRDNQITDIDVFNHWKTNTLETALQASSPLIQSWEQLAFIMRSRCTNLTFATDSFKPLQGHPFVSSAAQRIVELLQILDKSKSCFDTHGQRTVEGQDIYQNHFTGDKAWFTDSSDTEKIEFKAKLTFNHPERESETLFCTWHGKIKTPQLRIHFSFPISVNEPLYVVYVGPKLTKR
ncbi:MAG: hypothetical protein U1D41_04625 [Nitrosomonas sp.]|uniref:hypothetical protein n=1 Tax=Nitrosomonas sp. TaxID=42353 RepID=UPI0027342C4A|nr:hypothetical protein [Nitrosomonas sp.]MDP3280098.1 hypothetical protein [Nitrosomonas sp.]MDP3664105.1 hypothetical protein [Nitrosomonas sp.]MDZ4105442.1 hypothetical protein [Nitrosomonas sp.]